MPRRAQVVELPSVGTLDRSAGALGRQLAQALRQAICSGTLKPGDPLPSSRELAKSLSLSRGTVLEAFDQLVAEGFLDARHRAGTRVAASLNQLPAPRRKEAVARPALTDERVNMFARVAEQFLPLPPVPFAVSVPKGAAAPDDVWRRLGNRMRTRGPGAPSSYEHPQGLLALRGAVADYVRRSRSAQCNADQVIITTGTQQGLFLATQVLLGPADQAWVEDPAYRGITGILESLGHQDQMVRVPVDSEGLDVQAGSALARHARVAFVTPSHQYPLGMPMSMARRTALIAWASAHRAWIVEDDYDSELRYAGHPFPSMQGLAPERVIYLGTFSKILFPSLRLGYAVVPQALVPAFCGARALMDRHSPNADQYVLAAFINEGHLDRHIRRVRTVYAEQRSLVMGLLRRWVPQEIAWLQPSDQGMHLVLWLADGIDDQLVAQRSLAANVSIRAVSSMYSEARRRPGLILGLGGFTVEQLNFAVRRLAEILADEWRTARQTPAMRNRGRRGAAPPKPSGRR